MKNFIRYSLQVLAVFSCLIGYATSLTYGADVVYRAKYDPFGEMISETGALVGGVDYTFTGQERDPALDMLDYKARFYHPWLGRFSSVDPIDHHGESPYTYVSNNPLRYIDPTGNQPFDLGGFFQKMSQFGEYVQSVVRGSLNNVPGLRIMASSADLANYHLAAAGSLIVGAAVSAVVAEFSASDPSGTFSGSINTKGDASVTFSKPYGSLTGTVNLDGTSSISGTLKHKQGPFDLQLDSEGKPSAEMKAGETSLKLSNDGFKLVVAGTGAKINVETGKTTLSLKADGVGVSVTVDPERTGAMVNEAYDHLKKIRGNGPY